MCQCANVAMWQCGDVPMFDGAKDPQGIRRTRGMQAMKEGASTETRFGSTLFWRLFAIINLITVAWIIWVLWQIIPRPVVHDFVLRLPVSQRPASGSIPGDPSATSAGVATVTPVTPPVRVDEIPIQSGPPMTPLRMETAIKT